MRSKAMKSFLLAIILASVSCAPSREERASAAISKVREADLFGHLEQYSGRAGDLLSVRKFVDRLGDVASAVHGLQTLVGADLLDGVLSKITIARVSWELVDSLEAVQEFWRDLDALHGYPDALKTVLLSARDDPSEANFAKVASVAASGQDRLERILRVVEKLSGWTRAMQEALRTATQELRRFEMDADFWGVSLVVSGLEEMLELLDDSLLKQADDALGALEAQLRLDLSVLSGIEHLMVAEEGPGCSCQM